MKLMDKMERKFGFLAIHNLTLYIVVGQALTFLMIVMRPEGAERVLALMSFNFSRFLDGEVWRILSFILIPETTSMIFIIFALMILQMMGGALEQHWGAFRYNLYLLTGVIGVLVAGIIVPYHPISSYFLLNSIVFAFAYLYPNYELNLFLVLPVKVKWIAWLSFGLVLYLFFQGGIATKLEAAGALLNFPLFFGADILRSFKAKKRVNKMKAEKRKLEAEPFHVCVKCGVTDLESPEREFRYRSEGAVCSACLEAEQASEADESVHR